ncbi:ABC transporter ATP-binding protein [Frondihabitans australicus]|uniref:Putative spermidine/putrescine transport system ATP-binding protein n=1 Tax=Frondihabitans australicus TaxID=386892 RepID=A0A495IL39_9MICO|nr:ABC transporter ATP-binding protein [Frondihabitans australicus]RKR76697.1 putative spermidine/putrescine transport system ATP-binding protein [Frondihabitans australicus]
MTTTIAPPTARTSGVDAAPGLEIRGISKVLSGRTIVDSFDLTLARGELVALLGPSGCGKTTTLRMIAGFLEPDTGAVVIDGQDVTAHGPEKRPSAMVFQNYALWPHLTVYKNVAFPLAIKRLPKAEIRTRVMAALETVNLAHHANSRPAHISGGEQQRAALARAIVQEPELLLLDEPLSNLDAKLRVRVREEIRDIQQRLGITTVMVTHDQEEALAISDRVAVMNGGRIEQVSAPAELYARPETEFVAGFIGSMNFLDGPTLAAARAAGSGADRWAVRPEDVRWSPENPTEPTDATPCEVRRVLPHGHFAELVLDVDGLELRSVATGALPAPGDRGHVTLDNVRHYRDGRLVEAEAPTAPAGAAE